MIIATKTKQIPGFKYQLAIDEDGFIYAVNLLFNERIILKKQTDELNFVSDEKIILAYVEKIVDDFFQDKSKKKKKGESDFFKTVMKDK